MLEEKPTEAMDRVHEEARVPQMPAPQGTAPTRLADLLTIARRHVISGKRAITEQRERIEALRREGLECAGAESRLAELETTMRSMQDHVAIDDEARGKRQATLVRPLEQARDDVSDAVRRVAVQHARVERMRRSGQPTTLAEQMLAVYHDMLRAVRDRLAHERVMSDE